MPILWGVGTSLGTDPVRGLDWDLSRCRSGGGGGVTYLGADPVGGLDLSRC